MKLQKKAKNMSHYYMQKFEQVERKKIIMNEVKKQQSRFSVGDGIFGSVGGKVTVQKSLSFLIFR